MLSLCRSGTVMCAVLRLRDGSYAGAIMNSVNLATEPRRIGRFLCELGETFEPCRLHADTLIPAQQVRTAKRTAGARTQRDNRGVQGPVM